jgi:electron transfer flavoprotein alpha subunit
MNPLNGKSSKFNFLPMRILFLTPTETDNNLGREALETLGAARALSAKIPDSQLLIGIFGANTASAVNQAAAAEPNRVLAADNPALGQPRYSTDAAAAEALCRAADAAIILAPATSRMNRVMSGVAQRLGGAVDTHVTGVSADDGKVTISRWYYRQRMEASLRRDRKPWVILLDPGSQAQWSAPAGVATAEPVHVDIPEKLTRTTVAGFRELAADAQTIRPDADLLFVAGAGWTRKQADGQPHVGEAEKLILDCLRLARASLGSSKSLVDIGGEGQAVLSFLTHLNQVGQTGATPRHRKGLATCCHGEEPHTVGWRFVDERRAINLDANCGWARGKADILYVADAFAVMTRVNALLAAK